MTQNRVRATLAPADRDAVLNSIAAIREKLPFLIDLTADKRNEIVKLGDKSRAFVTKAFEVASHNPDLLPRFPRQPLSFSTPLFSTRSASSLRSKQGTIPPSMPSLLPPNRPRSHSPLPTTMFALIETPN